MHDRQSREAERWPWGRRALVLATLLSASGLLAAGRTEEGTPSSPHAAERAALIEPLLEDYCSRCHNDYDEVAGLSVSDLKASDIAQGRNSEAWEKILRRMAAGEMPPHSRPQPEPAERAAL
ncbi:MAG TPA: c-type cytochrome domain-containing protein, partial [Novosphingobium sp.]